MDNLRHSPDQDEALAGLAIESGREPAKDTEQEKVRATGDLLGSRSGLCETASQQNRDAVSTAGAGVHAAGPLVHLPASERYELLALLGKGGMGEIQLCRDVLMGRDVAVKRILPGLAENAAIRSRFTREAQIQGQL